MTAARSNIWLPSPRPSAKPPWKLTYLSTRNIGLLLVVAGGRDGVNADVLDELVVLDVVELSDDDLDVDDDDKLSTKLVVDNRMELFVVVLDDELSNKPPWKLTYLTTCNALAFVSDGGDGIGGDVSG